MHQSLGVAAVLFGDYLLEIKEARAGLFAPLRALLAKKGVVLAIGASALWGTTTVLEKLSIEHMTPPSGPFVALLGTLFMVMLLTPSGLVSSGQDHSFTLQRRWSGLRAHPRAFTAAIVLAGVAPLFGFTAIALGLVGYVTTLFKLSSVLTILWAWLFLHEGSLRQRLLGALVMLIGGVLVAL